MRTIKLKVKFWKLIAIIDKFFTNILNPSIPQPQPVTEGYQYNQLSPSRSPTTYTQLSGNSRQTNYHTTTAAQSNPQMWGWQNANQSNEHPGAGSNSAGPHTTVPVSQGQPQGQPQGQELSEQLLQMLDQSGTTTFEDLNINMFSTPFE